MDQITAESRFVASTDQVSAAVGKDRVILGMGAGEYFGVDGAGSVIWDLLQEPVRVGDLAEAVCARYVVEPTVALEDVIALVSEMEVSGLVRRLGVSTVP